MFTKVSILTHWNPELPIIVKIGVSDYALVAILFTWVNGNIHPIAYHSRTFNTIESNYNIYDKELLAIFEAFKK